MTHAILFGEYDLTIDEKNRLLIPSEIRRALQAADEGELLYITVGAANRKPWIYPKKAYEVMAANIELDMAPDLEELAYVQWMFSMTTQVEWDKSGRILMPEKTLRRTETGREVTLVGAGHHLELWNRSDWEVRYQENLAKAPDLMKRSREARSKRNVGDAGKSN